MLAFFYTLAVLVQLPNTRILRLSALVAMGTLAWRVSTRYNFDKSDEPGHNLGSMTVCVRSHSSFSDTIALTRCLLAWYGSGSWPS